MLRHIVTTVIDNVLLFGGFSKFEIMPSGGSSAGPLRALPSSAGRGRESDMLDVIRGFICYPGDHEQISRFSNKQNLGSAFKWEVICLENWQFSAR